MCCDVVVHSNGSERHTVTHFPSKATKADKPDTYVDSWSMSQLCYLLRLILLQ